MVLVVGATLVLAGCVGAPSPATSTATPAPTDAVTTDGNSPTTTPQPSVDYRVSAGTLPDEFRSLNVTMQVVFVENDGDFPACWRDTYYGPYKPTPTPIRPPTGDCYHTTPITVDLVAETGERRLGPASAPARFDAGHGLVLTNVSATFHNRTAVTGLRGSGGHVANVVRGKPDGPYRVELGIESYRDRPYDYWLVSTVTNTGSTAG